MITAFPALVGALVAAPAVAADDAPDREVVLLLDRSCSMPDRENFQGSFASYDEVVAEARRKAESMLSPYVGDDSLTVSLYFFGDIRQEGGGWTPDVRPLVEGASAEDAIERFDEFFVPSRDPASGQSNYRDKYTYVAASVYELVQDRVGPFGPCEPLPKPDDAPLLTLMALTDIANGGGESSPCMEGKPSDPRCAFADENRRRIDWLDRQNLANALSYTHWDMGHDGVELIPPDEAVYRVSWVSTKKGLFNVNDPAFDMKPVLPDIDPLVRMVPEPAAPSAAYVAEHGNLVCAPRESDSLDATAAQAVKVKVVSDWKTASGGTKPERLDGLDLALSERPLKGLSGARIDQRTLSADLQGGLQLLIPDAGIAMDEHPLRLDRDPLCDALTRAYPNSTFLLPPDLGAQAAGTDNCAAPPPPPTGGFPLAPVATVELQDREVVETYTYSLSAEGASVDAPLVVGVDRWWRAVPEVERTLRVSAPLPSGVTGTVDVSLRLRGEDGSPVDFSFDELAAVGGEGALTGVPLGEAITLSVPARSQRLWRLGGDFGIADADAGSYLLDVCITPRTRTDKAHADQVTCESCGALVQAGPDTRCAAVPVTVDARPFWSWWRIVLATIVSLVSAWVAFCWRTRVRFDPDLLMGTNNMPVRGAAEDLQRTLGDRFRMALRRRTVRRGPSVYANLEQFDPGVVRTLDREPTSAFASIGMQPFPSRRVRIWAARLPDGARLVVRDLGRPKRLVPRLVAPDGARDAEETAALSLVLGREVTLHLEDAAGDTLARIPLRMVVDGSSTATASSS